MLFVANARAVQVTLLYTLMGKEVVNVLHFDMGETPDAALVGAMAEECADVLAAQVMPRLSGGLIALGARARSLAEPSAPQVEYLLATPVTGGNGSATMPNNVALCLTLRTGRPGRSYRGRIFVPGLDETWVDQNYVAQNMANAIGAGFSFFRGISIGELARPLCVYSRFAEGTPRQMGVLTPVESVTLRNTRVDTQRKRLPKD